MSGLDLGFCFWDYDRTLPIADGRVTIDGVNASVTILRPEDAFARAFTTAEFDVTELSFSNYMSAVSQGRSPYVAVPAFPSRAFRHGCIFVRADRGIEEPRDLAGCSIGLQEYQMTAALVVRGVLRDCYGVLPSDIRWIVGRVDQHGAPVPAIPDRPGVDIVAAPQGRLLDEMLADGAIDGLIALSPPPSFLRGDGRVRRLFPDWRATEQAYFRSTGIFPIMHTVGIRRTLVERHPELAPAVYRGFVAARDLAIANLAVTQAPKATLPWVSAELDATRAVMGHDFWPYGIAANRVVLETLIRHAAEDGLIARPLCVEELFVSALLDT
jgi:4,5-dihydroxyphthalate decarboxylase